MMTLTNDEARPVQGAGSKVENPGDGFDASTIRQACDVPRAIQPATLAEMRRLVGDLDAHHREVREAYAEGYRDGHHTGWETGYGHAHHEMAEEWRKIAEHVRRYGRMRTFHEVELARWDGGTREAFGRPRPGDFPGTAREEVA